MELSEPFGQHDPWQLSGPSGRPEPSELSELSEPSEPRGLRGQSEESECSELAEGSLELRSPQFQEFFSYFLVLRGLGQLGEL